jgi:hypothetical protein
MADVVHTDFSLGRAIALPLALLVSILIWVVLAWVVASWLA